MIEPVPRLVETPVFIPSGQAIPFTTPQPLVFQTHPKMGTPWNIRNIYCPLTFWLLVGAGTVATSEISLSLLSSFEKSDGYSAYSQQLDLILHSISPANSTFICEALISADLTNSPIIYKNGDQLNWLLSGINTLPTQIVILSVVLNARYIPGTSSFTNERQDGTFNYEYMR